jgi:hypothetical protein
MRPEETAKALRQQLRTEGKLLKQLGAQEVLEIAACAWLAAPVEGLRKDEGDGLVAYFELLDRRGTVYEFGVNRILRPPEEPSEEWHAWSPAWKLRLSVGFKPTLEVFQLKPVVTTFACWNKTNVASFTKEVEQSAPFKVIAQYKQHVSSINLSECSGPSGAASHPTQGFSWAIA